MSQEDKRGPYYKGSWKRSIPYKDKGFAIDKHYDEPHHKRKRAILKKYPQVAALYGPSYKTKYIIFAVAIAHFVGLYLSTKIHSKIAFFFFALCYGGTLTSLAGILIHECSHCLVHRNPLVNIILGYASNIPIIVPMFTSFQKYHLDHHHFLGIRDKDPDLPMDIEVKFVEGNTLKKLIYIMIYPIFYIGRSFKIKKRVLKEEIINVILHVLLVYTEYYYFGMRGIVYHVLATWLGYSIHPVAAHLIQEHFTFADGQETYSYYGWMNALFLNIGYHNEHHDFCNISWDKLPEINKIANEFYACYMTHNSWVGLLYRFVTEPVLGPQSRLARDHETHLSARKMKIKNS